MSELARPRPRAGRHPGDPAGRGLWALRELATPRTQTRPHLRRSLGEGAWAPARGQLLCFSLAVSAPHRSPAWGVRGTKAKRAPSVSAGGPEPGGELEEDPPRLGGTLILP